MAATSGADPGFVASQVPFFDMCALMEKISNTNGTEKKRAILRTFLEAWREAHRKIHGQSKTTDCLFPAVRMLLPHLDKDRPAYGMKEVVLAKHYIEVLSIGKDSPDGRKLLNYRHPTASKQDVAGDFASVAYFVLRNRCPDKGSLNVEQVNKYLDDIAKANLEKKRDEVKKSLQILLRNTSATEQELKTGLSENSVLGAFHPDAIELYNICNSLSKVCQDLHDPNIRLNEAEIMLLTPFRPMLGQRGSIEQVEGLMNHQAFYIETKIDGERMQLHKQGDQYKYFSRSGNDYTHTFGESSKEGFLTPHISGCFLSSTDSCILDGEMVVYDPKTDVLMTKATHVDVKSVSTYERGLLHPCFIVFDVLLLNGKKLANTPLQERILLQDKVFKPLTGYIQFVERNDAATKSDVVKALNSAIDRREEGLVVKSPSSVYKPNVRNGSGWIKIKPEYVDSLSDELDVLIVGGYFGVGRRSGMVSHFMCAVAVPPEHRGQRPTHFYSFCKVGSGYTMNELRELGQQLNPHWRRFDTSKPPKNISLASGFKEKPDVWIEPSNSKIVQIKAAEIITSDRYKTGATLRFPRLECVREDKYWYDCLDLKELERLRTIAEGKLTYKHAGVEGTSEPAKKKRRLAARAERPRAVAEHFRPADVSTVTEISKLFEGKEFCIVTGPSSHPKASLEKNIAEHGGTFTQNPGPDTFCVVASRVNLRVNNIIKGEQYDVVQAQWLIECLEKSKLLPWLPTQMLHTSPLTASKFAEEYDRHGDSFTEDATAESLRKVFGNIDNKDNAARITSEEIAEIEERYFPGDSPLGLFRRCRIYLDQFKEIDSPQTAIKDCSLELTSLELRFYGAHIALEFDNKVTHVVLDERDLIRLPELQRRMRTRAEKHHFVTQDWVTQSIDRGIILKERTFAPGSAS